ncbi:MAG TPA: hypothetical protein VFS00_20260, partial [Polyangiaceae bacterium]|nr:hypothetical protein [Polyangiaceae bacterium]
MAPLLLRLAGALTWLAATLALYALGAAYATAWHGLALAAGALVLLPLLLAHWFTRAHRRLDPASRFAQN